MSVHSHLRIPLSEYDSRIVTFIPWYEEMLWTAAAVIPLVGVRTPTIVDLGIGSGALSAKCVEMAPRAKVIGIDADADILQMASARLEGRLTAVAGNFESVKIPACDAIVSAFALHHVRTAAQKLLLYRQCHRALRAGRSLVIADCCVSANVSLAEADRRAWLEHLEQHYSAAQSRAFLRAWAKEDFYMRLDDETALLSKAGFDVDIVWRRHSFAVIVATKPKSRRR